jgi:hypothetical protein
MILTRPGMSPQIEGRKKRSDQWTSDEIESTQFVPATNTRSLIPWRRGSLTTRKLQRGCFKLVSMLTLPIASKFIQTFGATLTSQEAGLYTHHAVSTLEFGIKRHLDLNISFVSDYLQDPKPEASGVVPQHGDYRLIVGAGVKF